MTGPGSPAPQQAEVTPLRFEAVRLPGVKAAGLEGPYRFELAPITPRVARAAFEGALPIDASAHLVFTLHSPTSPHLRPDIIAGDIGFPSINLVNANGTVFRFSRGNLKDFFDISRPNTPQTIRLPVAAFIYDRDTRSNVPLGDGEDFFAPGIRKLLFDFLRHPEAPIDIELSNLAVSRGAGAGHALSVQDLVIFQRMVQAETHPAFSTRTDELSFGVSLSSVGLALGHGGASLRLRVKAGADTVSETAFPIREENTYVGLKLPAPGCFTIDAEMRAPDGAPVARSQWPAVRAVRPVPHRRPTVLGLSDGFGYDLIAAAGGSWDRIVVSMRGVRAGRDGYRFAPGRDPLPPLPPGPGRSRVMAVFGMPQWLSRKPDAPDHYRYGPRDWDAYADLVKWLAAHAAATGVTHYEIWNESTALGHWNDDFETLMTLHRVTRAAVAEAAPGLVLLGGCTHSWTFAHLERFLAAGGADHCDGLAVHGYTYQPEDYVAQFDRLEDLLARHCPDRPEFGVYITEIGFRAPAFDLDRQADWFTLYTLEAAARASVRAILWFRFANPRPELLSGYRQNSSSGYALVGHNDSYCRPAYGAYTLLHGLLQTADRVSAEGTAARVYTFWQGDAPVALASADPAALDAALAETPAPAGWQRLAPQRLAPETAPGGLTLAVSPTVHRALS